MIRLGRLSVLEFCGSTFEFKPKLFHSKTTVYYSPNTYPVPWSTSMKSPSPGPSLILGLGDPPLESAEFAYRRDRTLAV